MKPNTIHRKIITIRTYQTGDGDGWPVSSAHEEPPQDNLVEGSIRATGQEPVQLNTPKSH